MVSLWCWHFTFVRCGVVLGDRHEIALPGGLLVRWLVSDRHPLAPFLGI